MDVPADRPVAVPAAKGLAGPKYITWLTLAFMTTASVARSERVLPVALNLQGRLHQRRPVTMALVQTGSLSPDDELLARLAAETSLAVSSVAAYHRAELGLAEEPAQEESVREVEDWISRLRRHRGVSAADEAGVARGHA